MIWKDALRSLRDDFTRSFFYFLTLLLTSMFIFLFFNMMMSDPEGASFLTEGTDAMATAISIAVIIICMVAILFANDFFAKRKAKELAVRLICGATAFQLAMYLLIQTIILLAIAIPVGLILATCLMPLLNVFLTNVMNSSLVVGIHGTANLIVGIIIGFVIFFVIMLNLSFAMRNAAAMMFSKDIMTATPANGIFYLGSMPAIISKGIPTLLWLVPIGLFYYNKNTILVFSILSLFGLHMFLDNVYVPWFTAVNRQNPDKNINLVTNGFIRHDFKFMKTSIVLLMANVCLLSSSLIAKDTKPIELVMYTLSYIVMNLLLSLAIFFRYSTDLTNRFPYFRALFQIGCVVEDLYVIQYREVMGFYMSILLIGLLYLGNIIGAGFMNNLVTPKFAIVLVLSFIIPLVICLVINLRSYRKSIAEITKPK